MQLSEAVQCQARGRRIGVKARRRRDVAATVTSQVDGYRRRVSVDATHLVAEEVDLLESVVGDTPERVRLVPSCGASASACHPDDESKKHLRE